jgi:hypothetical protein
VIGERIAGTSLAAPFKKAFFNEASALVAHPLPEWVAATKNAHGDLKCGQAGSQAHLIDNVVGHAHAFSDPLFKSLDLACLQPKPRNLTIRKASLKFDALVRDRQVIANESLGVSRFMFKRRIRRLPLRHRSVQLLLRVLRSLHGN